MAGKLLLYDDEAREALTQGMDILARAVTVTLGPCGRHVAYDKGWGAPAITRDGVTVAKEIGLGDPRQEMGVQLLQEAATKTNDVTGDGTTTATVLAQALVGEGIRAVVAGANPVLLARGVREATAAVVAALRAAALPAEGCAALAQVATIAAADPAIGSLVAEVLTRVGRDGVVTVEDGRSVRDEVEYVQGLALDRGYASAGFLADQTHTEAVIEDPYVLVTDKRISTVGEVLPVLGAVASSDRKELLVIAEDVTGDALATLLANKQAGHVLSLAIKAPDVGQRRRDLLEDISIVTGARLVSDETGLSLRGVRLDDLGDCTRAVARWDSALIVGGQGDPATIRGRIAQLKAALEGTTYFYDRAKLAERIARLSSGVAIIRAGAATDVEMREKKARVEDALAAARAAREEGIVPGGGVAYLNALPALATLRLGADAATAAAILRRALQAPLRQIVANAGEHGAVVIAEVLRQQEQHGSTRWGYDAATGAYVDLVAAGIVDPVKVTRSALENASSVAQMILTTSVAITDAGTM